MNVPGVSISTASSMDVKDKSLSPTSVWTCWCVPFHIQRNQRRGCNHFHSQEYERAVYRVYTFLTPAVWTCRVYPLLPPAVLTLPAVWTCRVCPFLPPASWTCKECPFFKCRNVGLSGIQSVRYRIRGPSLVQECSDTGLRYRMPEFRCRWHQPRCRCPAMLSAYPCRLKLILHSRCGEHWTLTTTPEYQDLWNWLKKSLQVLASDQNMNQLTGGQEKKFHTSFLKGTVLRDRFRKCWVKLTDLGLNKGRSWLLNFSEAPLIFNRFKTSFFR